MTWWTKRIITQLVKVVKQTNVVSHSRWSQWPLNGATIEYVVDWVTLCWKVKIILDIHSWAALCKRMTMSSSWFLHVPVHTSPGELLSEIDLRCLLHTSMYMAQLISHFLEWYVLILRCSKVAIFMEFNDWIWEKSSEMINKQSRSFSVLL